MSRQPRMGRLTPLFPGSEKTHVDLARPHFRPVDAWSSMHGCPCLPKAYLLWKSGCLRELSLLPHRQNCSDRCSALGLGRRSMIRCDVHNEEIGPCFCLHEFVGSLRGSLVSTPINRHLQRRGGLSSSRLALFLQRHLRCCQSLPPQDKSQTNAARGWGQEPCVLSDSVQATVSSSVLNTDIPGHTRRPPSLSHQPYHDVD